MGRKVVIYTRVSTEDQKENGFSLQDQEERLRRFCEQNKYDVLRHYQDDASAKTFIRPNFQLFLNEVKAKIIRPDIFLCVRHDRFSRNLQNSLDMIKTFKKFEIEFQTIENNVKMDSPESLLPYLLNFILPQMDNERKGENTKNGMRQAQKLGRWMGKAPVGYKGDKLTKEIFIDDEKAPFIKEAFYLMSKGIYSAEEVRKILYKKGFKHSKNGFLNILKNPVYIGKILIKKFKDEPEQIVEGRHIAIIEQDIFEITNDIISGRRKKITINSARNSTLLLRGFLECNVCNKKLTGSASTSRNGDKHYYYHCQNGCKERFRADVANICFEKHLSSLQIKKEVLGLYYLILKDVFKKDDAQKENERKEIEAQIEKNKYRFKSLNEKYMDDQIDSQTFNSLKKDLEEAERGLLTKHLQLSNQFSSFGEHLKYAFSLMHGLQQYYSNSTLEVKHQLIGSIFPNKIIYSDGNYRTSQYNEVFALIFNDIKGFENREKQKTDKFVGSFDLAPSPGLEPGTP